MLQIKIFPVNPITTNCIVLWEDGGVRAEGSAGIPCAVVDPGLFDAREEGMLVSFLKENGLAPDAILLTHGHFDHCWGVASLVRRYGCPVYMDPADKPVLHMKSTLLDRLMPGAEVEPFDFLPLSDGMVLRAGGASWQVIATPGHTPGGVCFYCEEAQVLLSGDTLFAGSIGRTDLMGGDYDALIKSIMDKVMGLPGDTDVIPGHGHPTTISREAATNPFLIPFNEPDTDWWNQDGIELEG